MQKQIYLSLFVWITPIIFIIYLPIYMLSHTNIYNLYVSMFLNEIYNTSGIDYSKYITFYSKRIDFFVYQGVFLYFFINIFSNIFLFERTSTSKYFFSANIFFIIKVILLFNVLFLLSGLAWVPGLIFIPFIYLCIIFYPIFEFIIGYKADHPAFYSILFSVPAALFTQYFLTLWAIPINLRKKFPCFIYGFIAFLIMSVLVTNFILNFQKY